MGTLNDNYGNLNQAQIDAQKQKVLEKLYKTYEKKVVDDFFDGNGSITKEDIAFFEKMLSINKFRKEAYKKYIANGCKKPKFQMYPKQTNEIENNALEKEQHLKLLNEVITEVVGWVWKQRCAFQKELGARWVEFNQNPAAFVPDSKQECVAYETLARFFEIDYIKDNYGRVKKHITLDWAAYKDYLETETVSAINNNTPLKEKPNSVNGIELDKSSENNILHFNA